MKGSFQILSDLIYTCLILKSLPSGPDRVRVIICIRFEFIAEMATGIILHKRLQKSKVIDLFTVLWHVTRPLYESEVCGDLDMIETKN